MTCQAGHPSSLFLPATGTVNPTFEDLLHPGETKSLEYLCKIAMRYRKLKETASISPMTNTVSEYISSMFAAIRVVLHEYETLVVRTEARVLQRDDTIVSSGSFVPLASLKAAFAEWDAPFALLESLLHTVCSKGLENWTPGPLIDLLLEKSRIGVERIADIMSVLVLAVQRVWQSHLIAYVVHGALSPQDPFALTKPHRLNDASMPKCLSSEARDSIAYVGRAIYTVKAAAIQGHKQPQLPRSLAVQHTQMLAKVLPQDRHEFDAVIAQLRVNVSEWLWTTVLTRKDVDEAVDSL